MTENIPDIICRKKLHIFHKSKISIDLRKVLWSLWEVGWLTVGKIKVLVQTVVFHDIWLSPQMNILEENFSSCNELCLCIH